MSELKRKIMVVDDEPTTCEIIRYFLSDQYEVIIKESGSDAMDWLEHGNEPDLIISDINMPGMNGRMFLKAIRSSLLFKEIPLVMLSGSEDSKVRIDCLNLGADDFIVKPFNPEELKSRVQRILGRIQRYSVNIN